MDAKTKPLVALYVRVSTQEQAKDGYSIDEQKERLTKYCESMDWAVYDTYSDPGFSGAKLDRPAIQRLITDAENHKIQKVLVYKLDRLSRSQKDTLFLIEDVFLKSDVDFVSMTENFDTATPFGKAMVGMLSVFAQLEREQIKERMMIGREGRAKSGLWSGSQNPPTGYLYENGELKIDPYDAEIVRRIYKEYLSGRTIGQIEKGLKDDGIKSRYGVIHRATIHDILGNTTYAGDVHFGSQRFPGRHEAIVSQEDSERARAMLKETADKDTMHLGFHENVSLITGLCYCAECGQKMISRYWRKKDGSYVKNLTCPDKSESGCTAKPVRRDDVEKGILSQVRQLRIDPDFLKKSRAEKADTDNSAKIKIYEDKIESNRSKISRYMDLYSIGGIDKDDLNQRIQELNAENQTLDAEIASLTAEDGDELTDVEIKDEVIRMDRFLDEEDTDSARRIISSLIERVDVSEDELVIHWNF